jgi:YegS/Rv2252/BmrU family lipid kinase
MPDKKKHVAIVCNPQAGNGKALRIADKIIHCIKRKQISYSLFTAHWPQHWNEMTEVWIIGGDGTLNYFINQYPDITIPLSIFRGGTGNDFHQLLYGLITVEEQIEKVVTGAAHLVDAGICNEKFFLNGVGIGFDGVIVKDLLSKKKLESKSFYLNSILKNILGYKEKRCTLEFDGQLISQDCFMVNVANGTTYGGGFRVAPKASIEDGKLDLNIVGKIHSLKRFYYIPIIEKGKHLGLSFIQYYQTGKVKISSSITLPAHMDGEYFESNEFFIECLPKRFSFLW